MSDTPRTDAQESVYPYLFDQTPVDADFARQLERELAAMTAARDRAVEALKVRLFGCVCGGSGILYDESGNPMECEYCFQHKQLIADLDAAK